MKNITLGQYYAVDSPIHRLDPRVKIVLAILYIVIVFLCSNILIKLFHTSGFVDTIFSFIYALKLFVGCFTYIFTKYPYFKEILSNSLAWSAIGIFLQIPFTVLPECEPSG